MTVLQLYPTSSAYINSTFRAFSAESELSTQPEEKDKEEELDSCPSSAPSPGMEVEVEQIEKGVK